MPAVDILKNTCRGVLVIVDRRKRGKGRESENAREKWGTGRQGRGNACSGGRGGQQSFIRGGSAPRSNPLPFFIPFWTEKAALSYTFH